MKYLLTILTVLGFVISFQSFACTFSGSDVFVPTLERWSQHPGPKQKDSKADGDYWEKVPAPIVQVISVTRGTMSPGSSCSDAGTIKLEISLPDTSTYDISEFAFYFRVKNGKLPDEIFPDIPLIGIVDKEKNTASLFLAWLDGHPKYQFPLALEVEMFLVTNSLNVGPSTTFKIESGVGKG